MCLDYFRVTFTSPVIKKWKYDGLGNESLIIYNPMINSIIGKYHIIFAHAPQITTYIMWEVLVKHANYLNDT